MTKLTAYSEYTEYERPDLVGGRDDNEFTKLTQLTKGVDSKAFVIVMNVFEVLSEGFN